MDSTTDHYDRIASKGRERLELEKKVAKRKEKHKNYLELRDETFQKGPVYQHMYYSIMELITRSKDNL